MPAQGDCLAAYQQGLLSLEDLEWEPDLWPSSAPPTKVNHNFIIPEIDLQPLFARPHNSSNHSCTQNPLHSTPDSLSDHADLVESLSHAASSYGFFQVYNHNISLSALEALDSYARRFFSLPAERKHEAAKLVLHPSAGPSGYLSGNGVESSRNKWWTEAIRFSSAQSEREALAQSLFSDEHDQQHFGDVLEECSNGFAKLAQELSAVLLEGLGLKGKEMVEKYIADKETSGLKLCHYPAFPRPNTTLGLPPHSDVSILTLLWQDQVGGLQVHIDGEWITIKPRQDALVVNIGDFLQVWSNDHYPSIKHRVVLNTKESRYSMVYFYYSGVDSVLCPIQELLEKKKECSKFRATLMSEHRTHAYSKAIMKGSQGVDYLKC